MAETFNLTADDPRVGKFRVSSANGVEVMQIETWPTQDLHGRIIDKEDHPYQTIRAVTKQYFVALGVNKDDPEMTIQIGETGQG